MKLKVIMVVFLTLLVVGCGEGSSSSEKNKEFNATKVVSNDTEFVEKEPQLENIVTIEKIASGEVVLDETVPIKTQEELDDEAKDELELLSNIEEGVDSEESTLENPRNELLDEERIEAEE